MAETGFLQQAPGGAHIIFGDQNAARQNAEGPFQHAHVLIEHEVADAGALQQSAHRRNQDRVIGTNKLPRDASSPLTPVVAGRPLVEVRQPFQFATAARHGVEHQPR